MADYHWPPAEKRKLIGKRISRIDGPWKSSGRAMYTFDINRPGMLYGKMVLSPHAHAKILTIDTSVAEKMPGVKGVQLILQPGAEVLWVGQEIAAVAAETEEQSRDAVRAVKVTYQPLPFFAREAEPSKAGQNTKVTGEVKEGDPDTAFKEADVVHEGTYGIPVIAHCCLESHGQVMEWQGDQLKYWATTQGVSGLASDLSKALSAPGINIDIPASNIEVISPVMGGGFGSKFPVDTWGIACAQLSKKTGRAVKMMLERDQELMVAGARPSMHAKVRVGAKKDGTLTVWESTAWGTGGTSVEAPPQLPYVIIPPNKRTSYTAVLTNMGPIRPWRAPNHPQLCAITLCALDDLADKLGMDPADFLKKNLDLTAKDRAPDYAKELDKASELMDWKTKWHPRGDKTPGHIKRGVGVSLHTWGGGGGPSNCQCVIQPDGSVSVSLATQDLGVGTRTVVTIVAAETMGLPLEGVTANIGDSKYPASGASGGSTTCGGVSSSTRRAATNALNELLAKVAPSLNAAVDDLEAVGGRIQVKGDPSRSIDWKAACAKLAGTPITAMGQTSRDLISSGVGGVQMAEVSVDTETGIVKVEKMVAVQDIGLVMDLETAESVAYSSLIMGVTHSLYEEKVMDGPTGKCLNPNMEFYKLAGINDIGELVVHFMTGPGYDERGPIGLGEPPTISPGAALSNAVTNAIGVRVPELPLTPANVLAALSKA
ncbi:MAG: xanthine dehydrogenase family protein molybdopterin-binding subunit [Candidatus Acidiferrales bacterium]